LSFRLGAASAEEVVIATKSDVSQSWNGEPARGLARPSSGEQVADHIRRLIFENRVHAGDRLQQDDIAAELGVSRIPVREAIIALGREGWVTIEPNRGAFVNGLDENSTRDHYEILGLFYGLNARRAAERGTEERIAKLAAAARALNTATDPEEFQRKNNDFLYLLVHMTESRRMISIGRVLSANLVPGNFFAEVPGVMRLQKRGLRAVLKALKTGDGATAEAEFVTMLREEADEVVNLMAARGLLAEVDS
jgi:DNA-binding GntR family transcriptional regulator